MAQWVKRKKSFGNVTSSPMFHIFLPHHSSHYGHLQLQIASGHSSFAVQRENEFPTKYSGKIGIFFLFCDLGKDGISLCQTHS